MKNCKVFYRMSFLTLNYILWCCISIKLQPFRPTWIKKKSTCLPKLSFSQMYILAILNLRASNVSIIWELALQSSFILECAHFYLYAQVHVVTFWKLYNVCTCCQRPCILLCIFLWLCSRFFFFLLTTIVFNCFRVIFSFYLKLVKYVILNVRYICIFQNRLSCAWIIAVFHANWESCISFKMVGDIFGETVVFINNWSVFYLNLLRTRRLRKSRLSWLRGNVKRFFICRR